MVHWQEGVVLRPWGPRVCSDSGAVTSNNPSDNPSASRSAGYPSHCGRGLRLQRWLPELGEGLVRYQKDVVLSARWPGLSDNVPAI